MRDLGSVDCKQTNLVARLSRGGFKPIFKRVLTQGRGVKILIRSHKHNFTLRLEVHADASIDKKCHQSTTLD